MAKCSFRQSWKIYLYQKSIIRHAKHQWTHYCSFRNFLHVVPQRQFTADNKMDKSWQIRNSLVQSFTRSRISWTHGRDSHINTTITKVNTKSETVTWTQFPALLITYYSHSPINQIEKSSTSHGDNVAHLTLASLTSERPLSPPLHIICGGHWDNRLEGRHKHVGETYCRRLQRLISTYECTRSHNPVCY